MNFFLLTFFSICSIACFAATGVARQRLPKINQAEICKGTAIEKIKQSFAESAHLSAEDFRLVFADYRAQSPSHYAQYQVEIQIEGRTQTVGTTVQLNRLNGGCF